MSRSFTSYSNQLHTFTEFFVRMSIVLVFATSPKYSFLTSIFVFFVFPIHREALAAAKAKEDYMKRHMAGETEQARADLARLAIVR